MVPTANIIDRIRRRSLNEIVKILGIYAARSLEDLYFRYDSRRNKHRSEVEWAALLGFKADTVNYHTISEQFHIDECLVLPEPLCSNDYGHDFKAVDLLVKKTLKHQFDILGSGWQEVKYFSGIKKNQQPDFSEGKSWEKKELIRHLIVDVNQNSNLLAPLDDYLPIDWQQDFKANFSWSNSTWARKILPGTIAGTDIKVPWELSRFYHAAPLGYCWSTSKQKKILYEFQLQILDWISVNPLYYGVNWRNSMEVGIRALNWLMGLRYFRTAHVLSPEFIWIIQKSLYEHGNFIINNLEKNSFGANNHYLGNLVGLMAISASAPWLPQSDEWLIFAATELMDEMQSQVHEDGTHFEASTSYHRLVTEMFFQCFSIISSLPEQRRVRLGGYDFLAKSKLKTGCWRELDFGSNVVFPQWFLERLRKMVSYVGNLSKAGNELPQIGDNDSGRLSWLPIPFELSGRSVDWKLNAHVQLIEAVKKHLPCGVNETKSKKGKTQNIAKHVKATLYPDSGVALYRKDGLFLVISCGKNGGNSDLGGHAHNDKMSFELAVHGADIVVDPGSFVYTSDPNERNRFRSTCMHNTVVFPDKEQNPITINQLFELANNAKPQISFFDNKQLRCEHYGFGFKCGREFFITDNQIEIVDTTEQPGGYCILNLHPAVCYNDGILSHGEVVVELTHKNINNVLVLPSFYSPRYGVKISCYSLMLERKNLVSSLSFTWH